MAAYCLYVLVTLLSSSSMFWDVGVAANEGLLLNQSAALISYRRPFHACQAKEQHGLR
jgi:hypothetical protein